MSELEESILKDITERASNALASRKSGEIFGETNIIEWVRDSFKSEDEVRRYKEIYGKILDYVDAATNRLVETGKIKLSGAASKLDKRYIIQ
jgi:hypothetical protein